MADENETSHEKAGFFAGWKGQVQGFLIGAILTGAVNYFWVSIRMERNDLIDVNQEEKIKAAQEVDKAHNDIDKDFEKRINALERAGDLKERRK